MAGAGFLGAAGALRLGYGFATARAVIDCGAARDKLAQLVAFSNRGAGA
jgi:anthranilate phosphoribosyltransferase